MIREVNIRLPNVDSLSALFDRLIAERIKLFFFQKDGKDDLVAHQQVIIDELKVQIHHAFSDYLMLNTEHHRSIEEMRTFTNLFTGEVEDLVLNDIRIGEADRARLEEVTSEEPDFYRMAFNDIRLRIANERRAANKNNIEKLFNDE